MGLFDDFDKFTEAKIAIENGYYPYFIPIEETEGTEVLYNNRRIIMAGSNNYLGLSTHPKIKEAAIDAIRKYGTSCTGSRFLNGTLALHEKLENLLANFLQKESALCFSTGYQANLGVIDTIIRRNNFIILDKEDHASLYDGARMSPGKMLRFKHNDMNDLAKILATLPLASGKLVAVDGVFSMEGDMAPVPELLHLCKKYRAQLLVDDAHSIGVMGNGQGTGAHFGVSNQIDLIVGTFSKSFASLGGFVAGEANVIHFIKHHSRSLIFSASIPPANAAAAIAALEIIKSDPERIAMVHQNADMMRKELTAMGFNTGQSITPIIPVIVGERMKAVSMSKALLDQGIFVYPIISPAVPSKRSMLRTCYMATHTTEQLEKILTAFEKVGKIFGVIP